MVRAARSGVDETTRDARDQETIIDLKFNGVLEFLLIHLKHPIEPFCLCDSSRETVENETIGY